jgi:hypothetical protein
MQFRTLAQLTEKGQKMVQKHHTWDEISSALDILTKDGRLNPGLAKRIIADGYDPKRVETRTRLGLPPICINCGQRVKYVRHVPDWLKQAVKNLQQLETASNNKPEEKRVYGRGGKRVNYARDQAAFEMISQILLLN